MQDLSLGRLPYRGVGHMRRKQKRGLGRTAGEEGGTAGEGGVLEVKERKCVQEKGGISCVDVVK